jgi:hypothetical protein
MVPWRAAGKGFPPNLAGGGMTSEGLPEAPVISACIFFFTSGGIFFIISGKLAYRRSSCQPR